jgi:hypothetical protein
VAQPQPEPPNLVPWLLAVPAVLLVGSGLYVMGRRSAPQPVLPPVQPYPADPDKKVIPPPVEVDVDEFGEIREKT